MESTLKIPNVDISLVRRYSLADLDAIDFSTSDDFAIVVENLKNVITLERNIDEYWNEEHEQRLWQFVVDSETCVLTAYFSQDFLIVDCNIPTIEVNELFYIVKASSEKLISADYSQKVLFGTLKAPFFESLFEILYTVYEPMFSEKSDYSKCIKSDYKHHLSNFLLELFDIKNKLQGQLVFYAPDGIETKEMKLVLEEKELLNQVERCVIMWIWLLMSILMKKSNENLEDSGPLEEIKFWEIKSAELKEVLLQLQQENVKKCIEIIKCAKLISYFKFMDVYNQLQSEYEVALSNVKFLSILIKPCKAVESSSLSGIPKHLTELLDFVRIIWNSSTYFKQQNEISNLLNKVNNFVVKAVSCHVPLEEIFSAKSSEEKRILSGVISCCKEWLEIFDYSEKVHKKCAAEVWTVKPVSPLVNLFIHRCEELIQICQLKEDFYYKEDPIGYASGHKCFEISQEFKAIEASFINLLKELGKSKQCVLHIRKAEWNELLKKFKERVNELEISISKLMVNAFESLNTIEEGIQVLMMFQKYFEKQAVKRYLRKSIKSLYDIVLNELSFVKTEIIELKASEISLLPKYGGTAFCASLLPLRAKQLYKLLQEASLIWPREYDLDIGNYYKQVLDSNAEFIHTLFLQWSKTIPKDSYGWLKEPIITKKDDSHFLQLNLSSQTLNLIQELYYWDKTGVEIPQQVVHLHEKSDIFLKRILKMMEGVQNYNRLIKRLTFEDTEIFVDVLRSMEESMKSTIGALNWSVPPSAAKSGLKIISDQTKLVKEVFSQYENSKLKIKIQNEEIAKKSLFSSEIPVSLAFTDFLAMQVSWKDNVLQEVSDLVKNEIQDANQVYNAFKRKKLEVENMNTAYSAKIIDNLCAALVKSYETSLKSAAVLFGANRRNKIRIILNISLTLKDQQLCYVPDFKEMYTGIDNFFEVIKAELSTCMIVEGLMLGSFEEPNYFLERIVNSKSIQELKKDIDFGLHLLYEAEKMYNSEWNPCACLWETSKTDLLKGYQEDQWNVDNFEKDINRFLDVGEKIKLYSRYKVLEFCIVDCQPLKDLAITCAEEWRNELGSILRKISCANLQNAYDLFELTASKFKQAPHNLEELKDSINFLNIARKFSKDIELTFDGIQKSFDVLKKFNIPVNEKALNQELNLSRKWEELEKNFESYYIELQKVQAFHQRHFLEHHIELEKHTNILENEFYQKGPFKLEFTYSVALDLLSHYKNVLRQLQLKEAIMQNDAVFFHLNINKLEKLSFLEVDLNNLESSWIHVKQWNNYLDEWDNIPIMHFDVVEKKILSDDLQNNINDLLQTVKGTNGILLEELLANLKDLNEYFEMIRNFQDPTLQERHWDDFKEILNISCDNDIFFHSKAFTFGFIRKVNKQVLAENVNKIIVCARKEYEIEQSLNEIADKWKGIYFSTSDSEKYFKLEDTGSILSIIERHQKTISSIKRSKFMSHFTDKIDSLEISLLLILDVIKQSEDFQSKFLLLENVFTEQAVQSQYAFQSNELQSVKGMWNALTDMMHTEQLVWNISHKPGLLEKLVDMNKTLESIQQSLEFYLDSKRQAFPRFYYLSNEELLVIIGQKSPDAVQPFLLKCFDSINKLKIVQKVEESLREQKVTTLVTGMYSELHEFVEFTNPVTLGGPVELWMMEVEKAMKTTLITALPKCLTALNGILLKEDFNLENAKWFNDWTEQICMLSMLITWTAETANSIRTVQETAVTTALKNLRKIWWKILNQTVQKLQRESQPLIQKKTMMLVLVLSHSCEVIESLVKYVCNDVEAFEWLVHLRYYSGEGQDPCFIQQAKAEFKYGFEYLGNRHRLVITPLTNRCFLSLTTALYMKQAATLTGLKNTGKTETLKDLGIALGNYVLIINCSKNIDLKSLVRIISGLAKIGAWGLFKDFNRVKREIVSVLSQKINSILHALSEQKAFSFCGNDIPVRAGCGIFFSVNSDFSCSIWENSHSFRPVTIISPDISTMLQVYLLAYGFEDVKVLAADIQLIYAMAKEQFSKKNHYNFGLRIIVQFLKHLEPQKRAYPKLSDLEIIVSSLKSTIVPKMDSFDVSILEEILCSVFGSIRVLEIDRREFQHEIQNTLQRNSLQPEIPIIDKIHQLHELKKHHHAIILLGESGTGKTISWKTLIETYLHLHRNGQTSFPTVNVYSLNPKAYSLNELFGKFAENGAWKEGLFPSILKKANEDTRADEKWIILNGPVDIEWFESISSLLNSLKVLTIVNGERITALHQVSLIIETTDLSSSSPSTVSCCGVLYFSPSTIHWKMYLKSWTQNLENDAVESILDKLFERYFEKISEFCLTLKSFKLISTSPLNCFTSFTRVMESLLKKILSDKVSAVKLSRIFWLSVVWSIGAILDEKDRILFDSFLKKLDSSLEQLLNIYEYGLDTNFEWFAWKTHLLYKTKSFSSGNLENLFVPTVSTLGSHSIITTLIEDMKPVLLIGKKGSGKTVLAQDFLQKINYDSYVHTTINMASQVTSCKLQQMFEVQFEMKAECLLLPLHSKKLVAFMDDFDIGASGNIASQSSLEFLYMAFDGGIWYNRDNWNVNFIKNVCYLAAGSSSPDYLNKIPKPLLNRFSIINVLAPQEHEMEYIFSTLLKSKFSDANIEIQNIMNAVSKGSVLTYEAVCNMFRPIPSKLHYLFSLKDVKKVLSRICEVSDVIVCDKLLVAKFWFHECAREFADRFMCGEDKEKFFDLLIAVISKQFMLQLNWKQNEMHKLKFVKFHPDSKVYCEVTDNDISNYLEDVVDKYTKRKFGQQIPFLLFKKNIEHLFHVLRGIEKPYGNMILVGAYGTGKRSLSRISAFILQYEVFEITFGENYSILEFKKDLQKILYETGVHGRKILLLFSDEQEIKDVHDICLYYLSEVLLLGLPFDLFSKDELNRMYLEMSSSFKEDLENINCHNVIVENIKSNLNIIFCIAFHSKMYMKLFLNYPVFYKSCTTNWFEEWPYDALESISCKYMLHTDFFPLEPEERNLCFRLLSEMHIMALKYSNCNSNGKLPFETSSTFITFLNTFEKVLARKKIRVEYDLNRLSSGLKKISDTQEKVNEISKETKDAQEQLKFAESECVKALQDITQKKVILAEKQKTIQEKTVEIEAKEKVSKKIAIAAEEDLNAALPALEEAQKALEALNKRDIGEIKSYANPPVLVEIVLEAVMILRDSEASWTEAKRQLGDPSFLKELIEYDKDNISDSALARVGKYVKKQEFQPNLVGKVSFAAKSLCIWVRAMHLYGNIYKKVKPKMERLRIVREELEHLQKTLAALLQELKELEESISKLEKEHEILIDRKEEYTKKEKELALKLSRAESIIEGLSSEKERWEIKVSSLKKKKIYFLGDSFLASGYLTYLGPHNQSHRIRLSKIWQKNISDIGLACSPDFDLADFFIEESVKDEWKTNGLPNDQYSQEGAAIVKESSPSAFVVDPEGQANIWIKNMEANRQLKCIDFQDVKWVTVLESGITEGFPVLLQNVNPQLDSTLVNLLRQPFNETSLQFNNKTLERHPSFKFYLSTKLLNPRFSSTAIYQTCIVNFTIKEKGLEDQLLPLIVQNERSDLETKKEKLVKSIKDCKKQLSETEETILKLLSESQGSLLDDEVVVQALKKSKASSIEAEEKLVSSEKTEAIIDLARNKYRPCAKTASLLYFVLTDMALVDSTYVFTLDSYNELFLKSISKSPRDSEVSKRIVKLNVYHQWAVYRFACRTVLQKHSLLLAFYLCAKMLLSENKLDTAEYEFFIKGAQGIDHSQVPPNPCSQWLSQECWNNITQLEHLPRFLSITVSFDEHSKLWQDWYLTLEPEKKPLPGIWRNICSEFHLLLIVRCLRLDRVTNCIRHFISNSLDKRFLEYPSTDLKEVFYGSTPNKPIVLFTLSTDIDIEKDVSSLANNFNVQYRSVSLGEGQEKAASELIMDSAKTGYWAFISNCHLLPSWLPTLEKFVTTLQTLVVHENFRLWLGSSPTKDFPTSILQNSLILSLDSPKGIRDNMLKLYNTFITENEIATSTYPSKYKNLLFTLSFFHSILIGRENFQNLGFHSTYSFTNQDFKVSMKVMKLYLDEYKDTPWDALKQLIAKVIYGGHLENPEDEHLLITYYDQFFCDEVLTNVKYRFSTADAYYVPENGSLEDYINLIKEIPFTDVPEVFGQHHNAEIPYEVEKAEEMLKNMSKIQKETFSLTCDFNQVSTILTDIKENIPEVLDEKAAFGLLHNKSDPYCTILVQETKQYNSLLRIVLHSLNEIEDAICGKRIITKELNDLSKKIQNLEVPKHWLKIYPSLKSLGSWIQDLRTRVQQFSDWISSGNMPLKIWLPGFTSPTSVLYATLQLAAKNNDITLKELIWEYHVSLLDESHITEAPLEGVYIRGLLLQGAGWDKTNAILIEPEPLHLITSMPVIHFKPVTESSIRGVYNCPCYYTSKKTDDKGNSLYLFRVDLKTKKAKEHWIKLGTSLVLSSK